jgi:hypothetical protein
MSLPEQAEPLVELLRREGLRKPSAALPQLVAERAPRSTP